MTYIGNNLFKVLLLLILILFFKIGTIILLVLSINNLISVFNFNLSFNQSLNNIAMSIFFMFFAFIGFKFYIASVNELNKLILNNN